MSAKTKSNNRIRNKTIIYKLSEEENNRLNKLVRLSGMSKTDYILSRAEKQDIKVYASPRVYKALLLTFKETIATLSSSGKDDSQINETILEVIRVAAHMVDDMNCNS